MAFQDADSEICLDSGVLIEHAGVDGLAHLAVGNVVGEDPLDGGVGVRTPQEELAKVRHVEQGGRVAGREALLLDLKTENI